MIDPPTDPAIFQRCDQVAPRPYSTREYAGRLLWAWVQATLFRLPVPRGRQWRSWLLRRFGAHIADNVYIRAKVRIWHPWLLTVGQYTALADDVVVYNLGPIHIGEHSVVSQGTWLCAGTHDYTIPNLPLQRLPIRIGNGVWVAMQAFIGPDVTIGDNTVVGARAVVMKDLPANVVAVGNPARVIKPRLPSTNVA